MLSPPRHRAFCAPLEEAEAFLAANPQAQFVDLFFTSLAGVPRGKRLRRDELLGVYAQGRFVPGTMMVVDIRGSDCEATGLVWEDGDADRLAMPVPGMLLPCPWAGTDTAQLMTSFHELDGKVASLDPRGILDRVVSHYAADGLIPIAAVELEFFLVDGHRARDGSIRPPRGWAGGTEALSLDDLADASPFLRDLWSAADALGLPLHGAISEAAAGQFELTLHHRADALRAADDAILFKQAVKGVARHHGLAATFMAKPWAYAAGSGMHLHLSVTDGAGANIFAADDPAGSPRLHHAIGGMAKLLPESLAILAPNANSYRRYQANSYAPVSVAWGVNNRTVALRVPAGAPATRHIEHRVAGADANPYLAMAAVLAAAHHGLEAEVDPGPSIEGSGYVEGRGEPMPTNWHVALDRFERSSLLRAYLGDRFVDMFVAVKRTEQARYESVVTPLDYDWYLRNS